MLHYAWSSYVPCVAALNGAKLVRKVACFRNDPINVNKSDSAHFCFRPRGEARVRRNPGTSVRVIHCKSFNRQHSIIMLKVVQDLYCWWKPSQFSNSPTVLKMLNVLCYVLYTPLFRSARHLKRKNKYFPNWTLSLYIRNWSLSTLSSKVSKLSRLLVISN
jgi:hypothetical protein